MTADEFTFDPDPVHEAVHPSVWLYNSGRCTVCGSISVQTIERLLTEFRIEHAAEGDSQELADLIRAAAQLVVDLSLRL